MNPEPTAFASDDERREILCLGTATILVATVLWGARLRESLQLDETVTAWVCDAGFREMIHRATGFQFSPVAFIPFWVARCVSSAELMLRLPAVIGTALAAWLLARLGREVGDARTGALAALVFVSLPEATWAATAARPYALALAGVSGSFLWLVIWLRNQESRAGRAWAACAGSVALCQPLLGIVVGVQVARLLWARGVRGKVPAGLPAALGSLVVLLLPLLPALASLWRRREVLSYAAAPTLYDLVNDLARPLPTGIALLALVFAAASGGLRLLPVTAQHVRLTLAWLLAPPLLLFAVARLTPSRLYVPYYWSSATPAFALLLAHAARGLGPTRARVTFALSLGILACVVGPQLPRFAEDWREASRRLRPWLGRETPVVVVSGLVESQSPEWLQGSESRNYLLAPVLAYPTGGRPVPMPWTLVRPGAAEYVTNLLEDLRKSSRFALLVRGDGGDVERFLAAGLAGSGIVPAQREQVQGVFLSFFEKKAEEKQ